MLRFKVWFPALRPCRAAAASCVGLLVLAAGGCGHSASSVTVPLNFRPTSQMNMNSFAGDQNRPPE